MLDKTLLSICCSAEPMYEIHDVDHWDGGWDLIGICSKCRENTSFEPEEE